MDSEAIYPIREISQKTGVNPVTLRAWQRRYGLIKPARTESGHRLYSEQDIELINQILGWLEKGVSIGQVKALLTNPSNEPTDDNWLNIQNELMTLSQDLSLYRLDKKLIELSKLYPGVLWLRKIIEPWLLKISRLERPDQNIIEQSIQRVLAQCLEKIITIQSGPRIALVQAGHNNPLDNYLARYELQSLECRCFDLGTTDPQQLKLSAERLAADAYVIQLGTGITSSWFTHHHNHWPAKTFFFGQLGLIYDYKGWLKLPYAETLNQLMKDHEQKFDLV